MTRFLHAWWPVAAVVAFTAMLVLQIPRRALFFSPRSVKSPEPFVSIVALDDDAYSALGFKELESELVGEWRTGLFCRP